MVVIKDNVEFGNFFKYFNGYDHSKYRVYITAPVECDPSFIEDVLKICPYIIVKEFWQDGCLGFSDKVKYWMKRQLFYLRKSDVSVSCFQKFYISLKVPEKFILEERCMPALRGLLSVIRSLTSSRFDAWVNGLKYSSKIHLINKDKFDYVCFMRPDSAINIVFYNTFKTPENKIITFVRNYDTPTLKGCFTVKSDITISPSYGVRSILRRLHSVDSVGKCIVWEAENAVVYNDDNRNIVLYCTSHPKFAPNEHLLLKSIVSQLSCISPQSSKLLVKLHPCDDRLRYDVPRSYFTDSSIEFCEYMDKGGVRRKFHNVNTLLNKNDFLYGVSAVITISSTIVADAAFMGVPKLIFVHDSKFDLLTGVHKREHIKLLCDELGVRVVNCVGSLGGEIV